MVVLYVTDHCLEAAFDLWAYNKPPYTVSHKTYSLFIS